MRQITSCKSAAVGSGSAVNDLLLGYNDFRQLAVDYQAHGGLAGAPTTPCVQYAYADGSANTIRRTSMIYLDGRVINLDYGASGSMADALSRLDSLV